MPETSTHGRETEESDRGAGDVMEAVTDAVAQTVDTAGRVGKAVVNGLADVAVSSIDAMTTIVDRSRDVARERSDRQRTTSGERGSAIGRMVRDWADVVTDTTEIVADSMTKSAKDLRRSADRFAKDAEKPGAPAADSTRGAKKA
jgi:hypothetical protein